MVIGNRHTNTPINTQTHTNPETGPITINCAAKLSLARSVISFLLLLKDYILMNYQAVAKRQRIMLKQGRQSNKILSKDAC